MRPPATLVCLLRALLWGLAGLCAGGAAVAQSYPAKPLRVIVPYPPGDAADIIARLLAPKMSEHLGQQVIVENRAGASGQIGLEQFKASAPDGYTIAMGQGGNLIVAPHTYRKLPYDSLKDFTAVAEVATNYLALVANPAAPFATAAEMIGWAKQHPGQLSVATNGEGGFPHLAVEYLAQQAGFKFLHVPYKGATQIVSDVIGGQVLTGIGAYTSMSPQVLSGRVRLIAVTNPVRVPNKSELPLFADAVPGYDMRGWFGYIAPAATPPEIVERLNEEVNRALRLPEVAEKLTAAGLIVVTESAEFFNSVMRSDFTKYGKLVHDIGFQPQ
jgi:tripartite-type tricarboxylate transporter receptor subunit TctC